MSSICKFCVSLVYLLYVNITFILLLCVVTSGLARELDCLDYNL